MVRCSVEVATHASVPYAGHGHYSFIVSEEVCTCIGFSRGGALVYAFIK